MLYFEFFQKFISICSSSSLLWDWKIFLNYVDFYWYFVVRYCTNFSSAYTGINSEKYSLLGCNLKNCSALERCLLKCGLNTSSVTLLLSEVVLTYLNPPKRYQESNASSKTVERVSDFMLFESFVLSKLIAKERKRNSSKRKMKVASSPTFFLSYWLILHSILFPNPFCSATDIIGWAALFFTSAMFVMFEQVRKLRIHFCFSMKLCDHSIEKSASHEFESFVLNNVHFEWMNEWMKSFIVSLKK